LNLRFKKIWFFLLPAVLLLMTGSESLSFETLIETAAGYNDNVPLLPDKTGSAFMRYQMKSDHRFFSGSLAWDGDVFVTGIYRDYFQVSDNYQIKAGGSLNYALSDGRLPVGVSSEAMLYRDDYIEEDDRSEISFAAQMDWLATSRMTLGLRQSWIWADYRNPFIISTSGHHYGPGAGMMNCEGQGQSSELTFGNKVCADGREMSGQPLSDEVSRNDRIHITGLKAMFFLTPEIQSDLLFEHRRLNSSSDMESYSRNSLSLSLLWTPNDLWEISSTAAGRRAEFDDETDRRDTLYSGSIGISRFIGKFELFFQFEWTKNDSSLDIECFRQTVTQCGMALSF